MARWIWAVGLSVAVMMLPGCNSGPKIIPATDIAGIVNLDGKPMEDGEITFFAPGETPAILPVKAGKFEGKAKVGDNKVHVAVYKVGEPIMMDGKPVGDPVKTNILPPRYHAESTLTATIPEGGKKDLKFDVESK